MSDSSKNAVKWTPAQKAAIDSRGGPLLVSAAAGSGKTAVLSQRVIDIISDTENTTGIDRFLIVTFTNLAADEMRRRIDKKLSDLLKEDPFNENLLNQKLLLNKAHISTIDGFCSSLVKEYFYLLNIPSNYRQLDENEGKMLREAACEAVFERRYKDGEQDFLTLVDMMSGANDDSNLKEIIFSLYSFLSAQPFPEEWLEKTLYSYLSFRDPAKTIWGEHLLKDVSVNAEFALKTSLEALEAVRSVPGFAKPNEMIENEAQMIQLACDKLKDGEWDEIARAFHNVQFERLVFPSKINKQPLSDEEVEVRERVKLLRKRYKDCVWDQIFPSFNLSSEKFCEEITLSRPVIETIVSIYREFDAEYKKLKAERGAADFPDVEHWALELLVKRENGKEVYTELAQEISNRFDYVMVDEYQDVNQLQEVLFTAVSKKGRTLFMVGDVKQSIYRFRQAMPQIFISKKEISNPYDEKLQNYPAKIILDANFRSRRCVTDSVNSVFKKLMSPRFGGIDYNDEEALVKMANYNDEDDVPAEFHLVEAGDDYNDKFEAEAEYIAKLVEQTAGHEYIGDGDNRRIAGYGDICIIMSSIKSSTKDEHPGMTVAKKLAERKIPYYIDLGDSFFDQAEVRLVLSLLRSLENPARDIPLASLLISPLFGFTAENIAEYRSRLNKSLYEIMLDASENDERAAYFCRLFDTLRICSGSMTLQRLIARIYEETMLPEIVLSGDDGEYRRKNLLLFLEYAKKYEASGYKGLSGFLRFIDKLIESGDTLSAAGRSVDSIRQSVQILTVHKSKGLEFPICIVAGLNKKFNTMDEKKKVVFQNETGIGTYTFIPGKMYTYEGVTHLAAKKAMHEEMISEELRKLYVAMTRAQERLILTSAFVKPTKDSSKGITGKFAVEGNKVSEYSIGRANTFSEMLIFSMLMSKSGGELRSLYGIDESAADENDPCEWKIVINRADGEDEPTVIVEDEQGNDMTVDADDITEVTDEIDESEIERKLAEIKERLSRKYKYFSDCKIPVKASASAAAEKQSGVLYSADAHPAFLDSEGLTSAQKGTAVHEFVQRCDLNAARVSIDAEKKRLVEAGYLSERQAKAIDNKKVEVFLNSALADEIIASSHKEREYRFIAEVPAGLIDTSLTPPESETLIILQGAIDCLYETPEGIVIVDYKTDRAKDGSSLADKYETQLKLYKYAAEKIFERPVIRCVLWSFALGTTVEIL